MTDKREQKDDLLACPICGTYLRRNEGFTCPKCKRGPFCRTHRVPGERMCPGCVLEIKSKEISALKGQEKSIKSFTLFLQFIFLLFAIIFVAEKIGFLEHMEIFVIDILAQYSLYIGLLALLGSLFFYLILRSQRSRINALEFKVNKLRFLR
jgi:hypothetical protein